MSSLATTNRTEGRLRITAIDAMRGLVMLIMLLDHVRESFYLHHQVSDPMDVSQTEPTLFFSRLAAHICAPVFVFLTGLSAWLYAHPVAPSAASSASGPRDASGFLIKRGLLLVLLELLVVNFAWSGQFPPPVLYLQVIWVIGLCMIVLGLLHRLPAMVLGLTGIIIVAGHNALASLTVAPGGIAHALWTVFLHRGFLVAEGAVKIRVSYPLLPWIGIILLGYVAGRLYANDITPMRRQRMLTLLGTTELLLFVVLRSLNGYGENLPWQTGEDSLHSIMSFLNLTKYPPSLDFALLTLGAGMLGLAWLETGHGWLSRVCSIFGAAPMFYYLLHLYVLLFMQILFVNLFGANHGQRFGVDHVWQLWLISAALIPALYYPCRSFARFKRHSGQAWVRYF